MQIIRSTDLRGFNTFGINAHADGMIILEENTDYQELFRRHLLGQEPHFVLGQGSNVLFIDDYPGTIIHPTNHSIQIVEDRGDSVVVAVGAGHSMNDFVWYCIEQGWHGLENLVAIPGTVGASVVQNVGAYGTEAKDCILRVSAYDLTTGQERLFESAECAFGYRQSVFKQQLQGRYLISHVYYLLQRHYTPVLEYKALAQALAAESLTHPTAHQVATVVADMRRAKLPDPAEIGSAGSFFKNPVVTASQYYDLLERFPNLVAFPLDDGRFKLAAGWLIEHVGWKGRGIGRVAVYPKQALVLVNQGGCTGREVVTLANAIIADVEDKYGVTLEPEVIYVQ